MRIIALIYAAILIALILWLVWEWRADARDRQYWREHGTRRTDRLPPA